MCFFANATVIPVIPGTATLSSAVSSAVSGDTLELAAGNYTESISIAINKQIVIKAASNAIPVINSSCAGGSTPSFTISASVTLQGLTLDGKSVTGYATNSTTTGIKIKLLNCTYQNYIKYCLYFGTSSQVDSLIVSDCIFKNLGRNVINTQTGTIAPGTCKYIKMSNSTFSNTNTTNYAVAAFNISANDAILGSDPKVIFDHCNIYNHSTGTVISLSNIDGAEIKNCIFQNLVPGQNAVSLYGSNSLVSNCIYFNENIGLNSGALSSSLINSDPLFVNAASGDFRLNATSPAINAATDGTNIGDPRWAVVGSVTGLDNTNALELFQTYPNPFKSSTNVQFSITKNQKVSICVYNSLGVEIAQLTNGLMIEGRHSVIFNAENLASGVYFVQMATGNTVNTKRILLTK